MLSQSTEVLTFLSRGQGVLRRRPTWTSLLQYYEDDIEYSDPIVTIQGIGTMTEFLGRLFASGPDLVTTVEGETCIDGIYTATWTMVGSLDGVPYSAKGMSIVKSRGRSLKAYYAKDYYSEGDIMAGIEGLNAAIAAFRTFYRCVVDPTFDCPLAMATERAAPEDKGPQTEETPFAAGSELRQNVPNPFNPYTTISFEVPDGGAEVAMRIYDVLGAACENSGRRLRTVRHQSGELGREERPGRVHGQRGLLLPDHDARVLGAEEDDPVEVATAVTARVLRPRAVTHAQMCCRAVLTACRAP
jgi:hypothetical protein